MNAPQELLKQYVQSQHFTSTADIMAAMKDMFRDVIQQVMEVEMDEELGRERCQRSASEAPNYRNGYSQKTVKTQLGEIDIKVPRDRKGNYEPKIISKYDRNAEGMEDKILSLYACGMSQRDIAEQIKSLYDVEISPELVSKISEKIMPEVNAWQNRPLESVYPFIFMDAIHYKVKEDHRYVTKAAYVILGITMDGRKDILGVWIGEHESSKFWLSVLNDLKSRGVLDVYLFCTDGLCGMMQAIQAVYPKSRLQRCIVHQIRSSTKYVSYKDIKKLVADLKKIYTAVTLQEAEENLHAFADEWRKQYPSCVKSWEDNWEVLSTFFEYPPEIRKIIYTTNIIEGLNRQFRQITKNKPSFTNDDSLRRMLYLASQRIVKHWHARCQNCGFLFHGHVSVIAAVVITRDCFNSILFILCCQLRSIRSMKPTGCCNFATLRTSCSHLQCFQSGFSALILIFLARLHNFFDFFFVEFIYLCHVYHPDIS